MNSFTLSELMDILETAGCRFQLQHLNLALARLELGFILERKKETYSFRVPLFKKMIREQYPQKQLEKEIKDQPIASGGPAGGQTFTNTS